MAAIGTKRKRPVAETEPQMKSSRRAVQTDDTVTPTTTLDDSASSSPEANATPKHPPDTDDIPFQLRRIADSARTPFEKKVWTLLCQIPRGSVSTYGIMSKHLGSSPRAVGNALRRNPFAPGVPCHRVVATGGALGGFKGKWPRDGEGITVDEKRLLLRREGVRFDEGGGRVLGTPFEGFV